MASSKLFINADALMLHADWFEDGLVEVCNLNGDVVVSFQASRRAGEDLMRARLRSAFVAIAHTMEVRVDATPAVVDATPRRRQLDGG